MTCPLLFQSVREKKTPVTSWHTTGCSHTSPHFCRNKIYRLLQQALCRAVKHSFIYRKSEPLDSNLCECFPTPTIFLLPFSSPHSGRQIVRCKWTFQRTKAIAKKNFSNFFFLFPFHAVKRQKKTVRKRTAHTQKQKTV